MLFRSVIGGGDTASGTLTTDALSGGSYAITGVTGTFDGQAITGLAAPGQGPSGTDNRLLPGPKFLDLNGFAFTFSGGGPETIYGAEGCCTFFDYSAAALASDIANFSASPVNAPEPASAGVFGMGMAALGMLRRRRRAASSAVPAVGVATPVPVVPVALVSAAAG